MELKNYAMLSGQNEPVDVIQYENFKFDFIKKTDERKITDIRPQDDFLKCKTLDDSDLYVYCHDDFEVAGKLCHLTSGMVMDGQIENKKIVGIRFLGGILSKLFTPNAINPKTQNQGTILQYTDDSKTYDGCLDDENIEIRIGSAIKESRGIAGTVYANDIVEFQVIFKNGLKLEKIRPIIFAVIEMCQFMVSRKNIGFDSIHLLEEYQNGENSFYSDTADIFFDFDNNNFTGKKWIECLSFDDVGDSLPRLFEIMYLKGSNNTAYFPISYFPDEDRDVYWFDEKRIKNICTAVENEAARQGLRSSENKEFEDLKKRIKDIIIDYNNKEWMTDRTYSLINSSISNWDFSAYDKYIALFEKYNELVIQTEFFKCSIKDFEKNVADLIKYRNGSTHGKHLQVTPTMADTAMNLIVLIYCSRLDYLGISQDVIRKKLEFNAFC